MTRHRARLQAELTKIRIRRGFASLMDFRVHVDRTGGLDVEAQGGVVQVGNEAQTREWPHPRWVRINTLRTSLEEQLQTTFAGFKQMDSVSQLLQKHFNSVAEKVLYIDKHIPNLLAVPTTCNLSKAAAYQHGLIILQDKASCFPSYLLNPKPEEGDILDACAAPGNKTTHLAALLHDPAPTTHFPKIWACERDKARSVTLQAMISKAGAGNTVSVKAKQDFLTLDPLASPWNRITSLLLDPSCSGSGIIGRNEDLRVVLPSEQPRLATKGSSLQKKKRKRLSKPTQTPSPLQDQELEHHPPTIATPDEDLPTRLAALSAFQLKLLLHAFRFPAARKIIYSTCSLYPQENEQVVLRALGSEVAVQRGWRVLRREEQVIGARAWEIRGDEGACREFVGGEGGEEPGRVEEVAKACLRCEKGTEEGTQGFFVAGFVQESDQEIDGGGREEDVEGNGAAASMLLPDAPSFESEWDGFSTGEE